MDSGQPFLALCVDAEGDVFTPTIGEYVVNPLDEPLREVRVRTGGFVSSGADGVLEATSEPKAIGEVAPRSGVRYQLSTVDEFDEFVVWWELAYVTADGAHRVQFRAGKREMSTPGSEEIPILGRRGRLPFRVTP